MPRDVGREVRHGSAEHRRPAAAAVAPPRRGPAQGQQPPAPKMSPPPTPAAGTRAPQRNCTLRARATARGGVLMPSARAARRGEGAGARRCGGAARHAPLGRAARGLLGPQGPAAARALHATRSPTPERSVSFCEHITRAATRLDAHEFVGPTPLAAGAMRARAIAKLGAAALLTVTLASPRRMCPSSLDTVLPTCRAPRRDRS